MATIFRRAAQNLSRTAAIRVSSTSPTFRIADVISKSEVVRLPVMCNRLYSSEIDISDAESKRQLTNRLLYRSKQRGFLELDLVLGKWVEENIHSMDENGFKSLIQVLDLENPNLWKWLTGQEQPPESVSVNPVFAAVREKVTGNLDNYSAPETRSNPGQPWVRGWDDFKRGKDGPITGNQ